MGKRIISILLMMCLCISVLAGCGASGGASAPSEAAADNSTAQDGSQKILGIIGDATLSSEQADVEALCESCGVDFWGYADYTWLASDEEKASGDAISLIADYGCTTIIFAVKGTEQIADQFSLQHPEIEVIIADVAGITEPVIEAQYKISYVITDFSEDRAWVSFFDSASTIHFGLIDENGYLLYSISEQEIKDRGLWYTGWGDNVGFTEFNNGKTCIYAGRHVGCGMLMINRAGEICFDSEQNGESHDYAYFDEGDGVSLVYEHVKDFSTDARYCCEIDASGNILSRIEVDRELLGGTIPQYVGEGIFSSNKEVVYNSKTHNLFQRSGMYGDILTCDAGFAFIAPTRGVYKVPIEFLENEEAWENFDVKSTYMDLGMVAVANGLINSSSGIYDYNGTLIASYPDDWEFTGVRAFEDGYAAVTLKGVDKKNYIAIVDTEGNLQYEPQKYDLIISSERGYVLLQIDGNKKAFSPSGIEITEEEYWLLLAERKAGESGVIWANYKNGSGSMGYNFFDKDGNILDTVYVVSNYGELSGQNSESSTPAASKDYISVSDFSIESKWKNVGTYTFGQVQSGAIVAFDGTNCNFYSPKDTYAFYKDGDHYKLECTSLLAETLSFTVKIVDEDNIDIFNGSNIIELTRVE